MNNVGIEIDILINGRHYSEADPGRIAGNGITKSLGNQCCRDSELASHLGKESEFLSYTIYQNKFQTFINLKAKNHKSTRQSTFI